MDTKNKIKEDEIIKKYMDYLLTNSKQPNSVYAFSKENDFDESEFYNYFSTFDLLEKQIYYKFCHQSIEMLENSEEYQQYDHKQKLLSFYYTFFEMLTANRSFVCMHLNDSKGRLKSLRRFSKMKECFLEYIESLSFETIDFKEERINKLKDKTLNESAWIQLLLTMEFWLKDDSKGFENTDLYIEKSLKASFDLLEVTPLRSVFDFAKFLYKQKVRA
ncbi:MAG: TetR/AcrR family transcriptional regulator [Flavobacteriaceae bacterium]|nr:TetR/AcrR family transcriptional regulator [Flavobacteriaceae bacterium]